MSPGSAKMPERLPVARAAASRRANDSSPSAKRKKRDHVELKVEQATPERGARGASTSATPASPGAPPFAPPGDWPEVLRLIKRMRAAGGAPVDTMGCEKISEDAAPDAKGKRFVTLVSAMLSSQTKDPITHAATARLVAFGCTPENIAGTSVEELDASPRWVPPAKRVPQGGGGDLSRTVQLGHPPSVERSWAARRGPEDAYWS